MPWGMGDLARDLGFERIIELDWWESFQHGDYKVTLTPCKHWGARVLRDSHRGYGGFVLEHQGRKIYHAGDSAYFDGFKQIGKHFAPEIALLPIGAYRPESFRNVHMGPDEAIKVFHDIRAQMVRPHALRHLPPFLRRHGRTPPLAPPTRRRPRHLPLRPHARRRRPRSLLKPPPKPAHFLQNLPICPNRPSTDPLHCAKSVQNASKSTA